MKERRKRRANTKKLWEEKKMIKEMGKEETGKGREGGGRGEDEGRHNTPSGQSLPY